MDKFSRSWVLAHAMQAASRRYRLVSKSAALRAFAQDVDDYNNYERFTCDDLIDDLRRGLREQVVIDLLDEAAKLDLVPAGV